MRLCLRVRQWWPVLGRCVSRDVLSPSLVGLCHGHRTPVTLLWDAGQGHLHPAACTASSPPHLSPPAAAGLGLGQGGHRPAVLPEILPVPTRGLILCQPSQQLSLPAEISGFAVGLGFLQLFLRRWAGHGQPWHRGHQSQHRARWGREIRGPDTKNSKAKAARAHGRVQDLHLPKGHLVLTGRSGPEKILAVPWRC